MMYIFLFIFRQHIFIVHSTFLHHMKRLQVQFVWFSIHFYDFRLSIVVSFLNLSFSIYKEGSITKICVSHQNQLRRKLHICIYFEYWNMWSLSSFCLQQKQQNKFDVFILPQKFNAMMYELYNFLLACSVSGYFTHISKYSSQLKFKSKEQMPANLLRGVENFAIDSMLNSLV